MTYCDWCGERVADFDRFCPATDCQRMYFGACEDDGDPPEHVEINRLWRERGWVEAKFVLRRVA